LNEQEFAANPARLRANRAAIEAHSAQKRAAVDAEVNGLYADLHLHLMRERDFDGDNPLVDWMVYVPRAVPAMPLPSRVEELKGLGSVIIVQPDPPVGDDAEELSRIRRAERLLRA
jgi:hypothetical protein